MDDSKFVAALSNFTDALDEIVNVLRDKAEKDSGTVESMFTAAGSQLEVTKQILSAMKSIKSDTSKTLSNTKLMLKEINRLKQERKNGLFDSVTDPQNKKGIVDGIKVVALIAGGVLAMGLAFKIVGDVDFTSVLALSAAIPLIAIGFAKVAAIKELTPLKAAIVASTMAITSAGLVLSGMILQFMPRIGLGEGISAVLIAGTMALAMWGIAQAADEVKATMIPSLLAVAGAMPLVAAGILLSGYLLSKMPVIGWQEGLTAIAVAGAMSIAMYGIGKASKGNINFANVLSIALLMPAVAGGLWLSSLALANMNTDIGMEHVLGSLAVVGSVVPAMLAIALIGKLKVSPASMLMGALAIPLAAGALMAASYLLSLGKWNNGIPVEWAEGFGLAMLAAVPSIIVFGLMATTGIGAIAIGLGLVALAAVAGGMVAVSHILATGNWKAGPPKEWAEGTGLALMYFTKAMSEAAPGVMDFLTGTTIQDKIQGMKDVAYAMIEVAAVLDANSAVFKGGPPKEWAEGTAQAIMYFVRALDEVGEDVFDKISQFFGGDSIEDKIAALKNTVTAMIGVATELNKYKDVFKNGPSKEWSEGAAQSVLAFAQTLATLEDAMDADEVDEWLPVFNKLAMQMVTVGSTLSTGNFDKYPKQDFVSAMKNMMELLVDAEDDGDEIIKGLDVLGQVGNYAPRIGLAMQRMNLAVSGSLGLEKSANLINKLASGYMSLADAIGVLAASIEQLDVKKLPAIANVSAGLLAISLIDSARLGETLTIIDSNKDAIKKLFKGVLEAQNAAYSTQLRNYSDEVSGANATAGGESLSPGGLAKQNPQQEMMDKLSASIDTLNDTAGKILELMEENANDDEGVLNRIGAAKNSLFGR